MMKKNKQQFVPSEFDKLVLNYMGDRLGPVTKTKLMEVTKLKEKNINSTLERLTSNGILNLAFTDVYCLSPQGREVALNHEYDMRNINERDE